MEIKAVKFRKDGFYTQPFVMAVKKVWRSLTRTFAIVEVCKTI